MNTLRFFYLELLVVVVLGEGGGVPAKTAEKIAARHFGHGP
jgi:hypothetical protein